MQDGMPNWLHPPLIRRLAHFCAVRPTFSVGWAVIHPECLSTQTNIQSYDCERKFAGGIEKMSRHTEIIGASGIGVHLYFPLRRKVG